MSNKPDRVKIRAGSRGILISLRIRDRGKHPDLAGATAKIRIYPPWPRTNVTERPATVDADALTVSYTTPPAEDLWQPGEYKLEALITWPDGRSVPSWPLVIEVE